MPTCLRCGGEMLAAGALISVVSRASFRPQDSKFLTLETGDVMTKATMCRNCGLIEIIGDVNKLRRLTEDPEPGTEKFLKQDKATS
jgi:ribosomal protein S27AE